LAEHFAERAGRRYGAGPLQVTEKDVSLLRNYDWPGNVRELATVIERAAILGECRRLDLQRALGAAPLTRGDSPPSLAKPSVPTFRTLDEALSAHIEAALEECSRRIEGPRGAAKLLAINPNTLRSKMKKLRMVRTKFRQ